MDSCSPIRHRLLPIGLHSSKSHRAQGRRDCLTEVAELKPGFPSCSTGADDEAVSGAGEVVLAGKYQKAARMLIG